MEQTITFEQFDGLKFQIRHIITRRETHFFQIEPHTHNEYELYINVSGDVSFMVENKIYAAERSNVIIAKPGEYHHCIYKSDAPHEHFWILIAVNEVFLEPLLDGLNESRLTFGASEGEELIKICRKMMHDDLPMYERYALFFHFFDTLKKNGREYPPTEEGEVPRELVAALEYINKNIKNNIDIKDMAENSFISITTLERLFKKYFNMPPRKFISDKRLCLAASFLLDGKTVQEAAMESGFCDCSHFICRFKEKFGTTPLRYKKQIK